MIHLKLRRGGQGPASLHLITQPPPQLVKYLHPWGVPIHRPLKMKQLQMQVQWTPPLIRKGEGAEETEVAEVVKARIALIPPSPPPPVEVEGKRKMDFPAKSKSQSLVGKRAI